MSTPSSDLLPLEAAAARLGVPAARLACRRLARGVTHETALVEDEGRPVAVLRLAPDRDVALPGLDVRAEGELLSRLPDGGVPRPRLLLQDPDGEVLGRPGLLFEYVPGHSPRTWPELRAAGGDGCAADAVDVLLALHRSPPAPDARPHGLDGSAAARVAGLRRLVGVSGSDVPGAVVETLDALAGAMPKPTCAAWVHGDFRPSNFIVRDGRLAAVLDWEMAGWGDPARDLGIATMPAWGHWWSDEELLDRYRRGGGAVVTPAALRWWRCAGYAMVVTFLISRLAAGRPDGPTIDSFMAGLTHARDAWEEST